MSAPREQATLTGTESGTAVRTLQNYIGGRWVDSAATQFGEVRNPASDELLARVPLGGAADVDRAVQAAAKAYPAWRATPPVNRVRPLFELKDLIEKHIDDIARIVTLEHGKTLDESRSSVRRAIDNVDGGLRHPAAHAGHVRSRTSPPGSTATRCASRIGVFAAITPFNFPAMVPMWFLPHAVACGNTFIVKPSERVPLSQIRIFELMHEAGIPRGRGQPRPRREGRGGRRSSTIRASPACRSSVARRSRTTSTSARAEKGKRVQALGGAKNFVVVMPDADMDALGAGLDRVVLRLRRRALPREQRRAGGGRAPTRRSAKSLVDEAKKIQVGDGLEPGRHDGSGDHEAASRKGARLHREGHRRRGEAGRSTAAATRTRSPTGLLPRPDDVRPASSPTW